MCHRKSFLVADRVIAPDLGNRDPVSLTQLQRDVCRTGWNIQIKRAAHLPEVRPFGHCLEMVDGLNRLDLDDAMQPSCSLDAGEHQVRVHDTRAGAHAARLLLLIDIDPYQESPSQTGL